MGSRGRSAEDEALPAGYVQSPQCSAKGPWGLTCEPFPCTVWTCRILCSSATGSGLRAFPRCHFCPVLPSPSRTSSLTLLQGQAQMSFPLWSLPWPPSYGQRGRMKCLLFRRTPHNTCSYLTLVLISLCDSECGFSPQPDLELSKVREHSLQHPT